MFPGTSAVILVQFLAVDLACFRGGGASSVLLANTALVDQLHQYIETLQLTRSVRNILSPLKNIGACLPLSLLYVLLETPLPKSTLESSLPARFCYYDYEEAL